MVLEVKYYVRRGAFTDPNADTYVKIIKTGRRKILFDGFILYDNGTTESRRTWELQGREATEFVEAVEERFDDLSKKEFKKAEDEYLRRESEETRQWTRSDRFRKYYGIDIIEGKQKSVMERVEKALKEEDKLRKEK